MRKIKEVLRLRFELGLGQREIAHSAGARLSTSAVPQYAIKTEAIFCVRGVVSPACRASRARPADRRAALYQ
jgi:hypothetical protein